MRLTGMAKHGVYIDDCNGVHPDIIDQYYGVHGRERYRQPGQTGAGHPSDEQEDYSSLGQRIADDQRSNLRHEPVDVPDHHDPFTSEIQRQAFHLALSTCRAQARLPAGYGLFNEELDVSSYPSYEIIHTGRRGTKRLQVALPILQWRPRAELWGQALDILTRIQVMYNSS